MNTKKILAVLSFLLIAIFLMGCNQEDQVLTPDDILKQQDITPDETGGLIYMILAEKLAHDVYTTLGEKEDSYPAFLNIASSEQKHMDQILKLLVKYEIPDPIVSYDIGRFDNYPDFEDLYTKYVDYVDDPLSAGIEIEEFIIAELNTQLDVVEAQDIFNVYTCLLAASEKHLAAFTK